MATHSDRSDWDSDTLHVKDVLPSFLDLSKFLPEMIDVKWLPPVLNLNIFQWVSWPFRYRSGNSALPELIIQPPTRVLPALSEEIDREESSHRFDYWFSFLVCGPLVMACLCEMIRLLSSAIKRHFAKPKEPRDYGYAQLSRVSIVGKPSFDSPSSSEDEVHVCEDCLQSKACFGSAVVCYHLFCVSVVVIALASDWISIKGGGTISWELWVVWQHACLWVLFIQNLFRCYYADALDQKSTFTTILLHTAPIVSELTDTMKDWVITGICLTAQPSKMGMILGLFFVLADFFPRALYSPPDRFPFRIVRRVWMPLIVWQIVFACFCLVCVASLYLSPAFLILMGIVIWGAFVVAWCPCNCCCVLTIQVIAVVVYGIVCTGHAPDELMHSLDPRHFLDETAHSLGKVLMDSGALFILSFYVICAAYYCVASDKDGARELRRLYFAILALPIRSQAQQVGPVGSENVIEQVYLWMSNKAVDFLSTARLLIAWVEDWPQGLLGLLLALGHRDQVGSFGFAAFSAIISFLKGILIPSGQLIIVSFKRAEVQRALMDSKQLAMYFGENSSLTHKRILSQWERALEERARDVLSNANILEGLDLYQPIYEDQHAWMMEHAQPTSRLKPTLGSNWLRPRRTHHGIISGSSFFATHGISGSSLFAVVCGELVSQRRDPEQLSCCAKCCANLFSQHHEPEEDDLDALDEILKVFPPEACHLGGFKDGSIQKLGKKIREAGWSLEECIKANYTVKMCLEAGYTKNAFKEIGFNRLHVVSGFNEEDLASIGVFRNGTTCRDLKEAGFSLEQCGEAGYTVKMCLEAGYTTDPSETGLEFLHHFSWPQEDLACIGVAKDATGCQMLKEAGFSLEQCGKAGYKAKMCLEAGYSQDDFRKLSRKQKHQAFTEEDLNTLEM